MDSLIEWTIAHLLKNLHLSHMQFNKKGFMLIKNKIKTAIDDAAW